MHIFWPVYEPYLIGNVGAILNQTTGYEGSERNIEPLVHIPQPAFLQYSRKLLHLCNAYID